jgi:hypothetical protein
MPDRTDVFLGGDDRNRMGDASFNLAKFSEDFVKRFSTVNRAGESSLSFSKLQEATPQELTLYDLNKDGKIDVTDALDIQTAGGATRIGGEKLQSIYNAIHDNSALMEKLGYRSDPKTFLLDDGREVTVDNPTLTKSYQDVRFPEQILNESAIFSGYDNDANNPMKRHMTVDAFKENRDRAKESLPNIEQGFFNSKQYADWYANTLFGIGTMDVRRSPYFGMQGSGSIGAAQDAAYEDYLNSTGNQSYLVDGDDFKPYMGVTLQDGQQEPATDMQVVGREDVSDTGSTSPFAGIQMGSGQQDQTVDTVVDPVQEEVVTYGDTNVGDQTQEAFGPVADSNITTYDPAGDSSAQIDTTGGATTTDTGLNIAAAPAATTSFSPRSATRSVASDTAGLGSVPTFGGGYQPGTVYEGTQFEARDSGIETVMYRNQRGQMIPVTLRNGKPITYVPPGYVRSMSEGGAVMPLESEHNLANKFLGYTGEKSRPALDDFYKSNPGAAARMGEYQKAVTGMSYGGYTGGPAERGRGAPAASPAPRSQPAAGIERGRTQQPRVSSPTPQATTQRSMGAPAPRQRDNDRSTPPRVATTQQQTRQTSQPKAMQFSDKDKGVSISYFNSQGEQIGVGDKRTSRLSFKDPMTRDIAKDLQDTGQSYEVRNNELLTSNSVLEGSKVFLKALRDKKLPVSYTSGNATYSLEANFIEEDTGRVNIPGGSYFAGVKLTTPNDFLLDLVRKMSGQNTLNRGGVIGGYQEGGASSDLSGEGNIDPVTGFETISYKDDIIPMFGDAVTQTMQPGQAPVSYIEEDQSQFLDASAGRVSDVAPYASAATVDTVETAMTPGVADTATYGATTAAGAVRDETARTTAATGTVSEGAQVDAAQGTVSDAAMADAAQFDSNFINRVNMGEMNVTSSQLVNAAGQDEVAPAVKIAQSSGIDPAIAQQATVSVNELPEAATIAESNMAQAKVAQSGGLLREEATAYAAKLDTFSVDNGTLAKAIQGEVGALGTVQGQLENLMSQFDDGTPAWAAGAMRAANAAMAARGLGGSSMAGAAILQAAMESALPIAQQDAQTFNQMNMSNLNRRQQVALTNAAAQQGLALQNLSNEQQAALQNSTNAFALQTQDLSNMQQTFLANAQIKSALQGQNLSNQQQANLVTAARYAEVSNMNLNNRQQTALTNNANNLQIELSNLSNKQQAYVSNAQLAAALQGKQIDNQQQAAIQNAARFAEAANINFTAEQQEQLHNSELMKTVGLANLSNRQAAVLQNAATLAAMDTANLNNRQQAAVQNAQSFLQMDMANLTNAQQTEIFRAQQNIQALFTDQAATNAASQFNATSENQTNQFFASLASQTSQFNATQVNATNQFNVNAVNGIRQFNSNLQNQRDQFNANNGLVVAQANAQWRQNIATLNTAVQNESNMDFAKTINELTENNLDHIWQRERDLMQYNVESIENSRDRGMQILLGLQDLESLRERIAAGEDRAQNDFLFSFLFDIFD